MKNKAQIGLYNMSKSMGEKVLYNKINLTWQGSMKIGLVGPNGAGKSTLFKIISKKIKADMGDIYIRGDICVIGQEFDFGPTVTVKSYLSNWIEDERQRYMIQEALDQLGLGDIDTSKLIHDLSGGQQRKLSFVKMMIGDYDIVLLDEPTNHLDSDAVDWLIGYLQKFDGLVVVISHDRYLLNQLCTDIADLHDGQIDIYHGDYDDYKESKADLIAKQQSDYNTYLKKKKKMQSRLADIRQRASVYDSPAWGRLLRSKEKFFDRQFGEEKTPKVIKESQTGKFHISGSSHSAKEIVRLRHIDIHHPDDPKNTLIKDISQTIYGDDRIVLTGSNGSGKTTLLKTIMSAGQSTIQLKTSKIFVIDQHSRILLPSLTVYDNLHQLCRNHDIYMDDLSIKSTLHQFGLGADTRHMHISQISHGQRVRLCFAILSRLTVELLILDEPTNHCDISTKDCIEQALLEYQGAMILVTHDRYMISSIGVTRLRQIDTQRLRVY